MQQVKDEHGGVLPADAVLRPDDEPARSPSSSSQAPPPSSSRRRAGRGNRFAVLNAFVDFGIAAAELTPAESLVWLVLFRDTKAATGTARTGQTDIARRAGLSSRAVKLAVRSLKAKGLLAVVRMGRLNAGPSTYRVHPTGQNGRE